MQTVATTGRSAWTAQGEDIEMHQERNPHGVVELVYQPESWLLIAPPSPHCSLTTGCLSYRTPLWALGLTTVFHTTFVCALGSIRSSPLQWAIIGSIRARKILRTGPSAVPRLMFVALSVVPPVSIGTSYIPLLSSFDCQKFTICEYNILTHLVTPASSLDSFSSISNER